MRKNPKTLYEKCKKIKLVLSDIDGVLTDGGMYYSASGEQLKKFNTKDGMGVELLLKNKIKTVFITKEKSKISIKRAKKLNSKIYTGIIQKENLLPNICLQFKVTKNEIAYIGDDINDLEIMKAVGVSAAPRDASEYVKKNANYVCKLQGGHGAFREIADFILSAKFSHRSKIR